MSKNRRVVVEISEDLHQELRRLAIMNDVKLYMIVNAIIGETLHDEEKLKTLLKKLRF